MPSTLLPPSRRQELGIAAQAEQIAVSRFGGERVDPEAIATQEGIRFRYDSFLEEFDGILLCEGGEFFLVCNERVAPRGTGRSRFTFAHELGHYFLEGHRKALASRKLPSHFSLSEFASNQPIEKEADLFAANLLMPATPFREKAATLPSGMTQVSTLASVYGTSLTSTAYRALALGILPAPAAIFRWNKLGASTGRRLSPHTYAMGPGYRSSPSLPPKNSVTAESIRTLTARTVSGATDSLSWFPDLTGSRRIENLPLREEVVSIGHYGWLTFLYREVTG